ncbi:hypothetical protein [Herbidospora sp. RD11066]
MTESPATVRHVTVDYEWAVEGKPPGSYNDYEVLEHSRGLDLRIFDEIRSRYATGASGDQPQVTIAFAGTRQPDGQEIHYVVLALQNEYSGHRDGTNRKIFYTRWFYIPYEQLMGHRVSYEALYDAFKDLGDTRPTTIAVRAHADLPEKMYVDAASAAGLLMTGKHVCVVGADQKPMHKRLQFIDEVASLLPYGMRTRLTAATWVSATADHKIRLSFAPHAADGTHKVVWSQGTEPPAGERTATDYFRQLQDLRITPGELVERLAQKTARLSFTPNGSLKALNLLEECADPDAERHRRDVVAAEPPAEEEAPTPPTQVLPTPAPAPEEPTVSHHGSFMLDRYAESLRHATQDTQVSQLIKALLAAVTTDDDRIRLQSVMDRYDCFTSPIGRYAHPELRYTALASAAFTSETAGTETAAHLLRKGTTPRQVKQIIKRARGRRVLPGNVPKYAVGLSLMTAGVVLFLVVAVDVFTGAKDGVSLPVGTATSGVQQTRQTVVVQAGQSDQYLADIYAQMMRNRGYFAEVRGFGTLDASQPQIVVTTHRDRYPGYSPLLEPPPVENKLIFNPEKIEEAELPGSLEADDAVIAVRTDFPDAEELKEKYPRLELVRMPQKDIVEAVERGDVTMAILPSDLPVVFKQSPLLDETLPPQAIHVLGTGLPTGIQASLVGVSEQLEAEWRSGPGLNPQESARKFADDLMAPGPTPDRPSVQPTETAAADEGSGFPTTVVLLIVSILVLAGGMFTLFWSPSRAPGAARR